MGHSVGGSPDKKDTEWQCRDVLLKFQVPVHREQDVVFAPHTLQQGPVLQASPTAADDRVDLMAFEH